MSFLRRFLLSAAETTIRNELMRKTCKKSRDTIERSAVGSLSRHCSFSFCLALCRRERKRGVCSPTRAIFNNYILDLDIRHASNAWIFTMLVCRWYLWRTLVMYEAKAPQNYRSSGKFQEPEKMIEVNERRKTKESTKNSNRWAQHCGEKVGCSLTLPLPTPHPSRPPSKTRPIFEECIDADCKNQVQNDKGLSRNSNQKCANC